MIRDRELGLGRAGQQRGAAHLKLTTTRGFVELERVR